MTSLKDQLEKLGLSPIQTALPSSPPPLKYESSPTPQHKLAKPAIQPPKPGKQVMKNHTNSDVSTPKKGIRKRRGKHAISAQKGSPTAPSFLTNVVMPASARKIQKHPPKAPLVSPPKNVKKAAPTTSSAMSDASIDRLIADLHLRSMIELRQQWMNAIKRGENAQAARFRGALLDEWERRTRNAHTPADYFKWPSTGTGNGGGDTAFDHWFEQGLLKYLGYQVGMNNGLRTNMRRCILDSIFSGGLPPVNGPDYIQSWGQSNSPTRLRRLAEEIARFLRNAKNKKTANMIVAIDDWEEDMRYLYIRYYKGRFYFVWP